MRLVARNSIFLALPFERLTNRRKKDTPQRRDPGGLIVYSPQAAKFVAAMLNSLLGYGVLFSSADELDTVIREAKGGDAAGEIRRLEDSLRRLRNSFQEAKGLATGAEEAAAKCQVSRCTFNCIS